MYNRYIKGPSKSQFKTEKAQLIFAGIALGLGTYALLWLVLTFAAVFHG